MMIVCCSNDRCSVLDLKGVEFGSCRPSDQANQHNKKRSAPKKGFNNKQMIDRMSQKCSVVRCMRVGSGEARTQNCERKDDLDESSHPIIDKQLTHCE